MYQIKLCTQKWNTCPQKYASSHKHKTATRHRYLFVWQVKGVMCSWGMTKYLQNTSHLYNQNENMSSLNKSYFRQTMQGLKKSSQNLLWMYRGMLYMETKIKYSIDLWHYACVWYWKTLMETFNTNGKNYFLSISLST